MSLRTPYSWPELRLLTDDMFVGLWPFDTASQSRVYRFGQADEVAFFWNVPSEFPQVGNLAHIGDGRVFDTRTWQRLNPPQGRKFHPDLARFAPDGRFLSAAWGDAFSGQTGLIDVRADKFIPTSENWEQDARLDHSAGFGSVTVSRGTFTNSEFGRAAVLRVIPPADKLQIAPDLLELWAQVAVRGELDPNGSFVKWDESTWEQKRQELASQPVPWPDFPFPGYIATDRLHWLRAEFAGAEQAEKPRLAKQLLERAEAAGDKDEAVRWRSWLAADARSHRSPAEAAQPPK